MEKLVSGFGMKILHFDPYSDASTPLDEMLPECDFVSIHCPLTADTENLFDRRRLFLMKKGALLVNTSRGPVVDEKALVEVLQKKKIGGAALDVLCNEPPEKEHPLYGLDNVVLTPHIAAFSADFEKNFWSCSVQKILSAAEKWKI